MSEQKHKKGSAEETARSKKKSHSKTWKVVKKLFSILFSTFLSIFLICIITGTIVATAAAIYVLDFAQEASTITLEEMELAYNTNVYGYDEEGNLVTLYQVKNEVQRIPVSIDEIPQHVLDAFVYTEDERFYTHDGVDYRNTIAAMFNLVLHFWDSERGGSTITQQLIKNVTGDDEESPSRKIREIFRAMTLEKNYPKDKIIETYLNYIGFGGAANGVQMASIKYFGKNVDELDVAEAAVLAAIPQSPETINPFAGYTDDETGEWVASGRTRNRERQEYVLYQMYSNGALSYDDYQAAMTEHLIFADTDEYKQLHPDWNAKEYDPNEAATSWTIDAAIYEVEDYLMETYSIDRKEALHRINTGGYQIYTTIDPKMQAYCEEKYLSLDNLISTKNSARYTKDTNKDGEINEEDEPVYPQSAFIAMNYEGEILACVGAIGEKEGALIMNYATMEPRQPGSTIKPLCGYGYGIYSGEFHWGSMIKDYGIELPNGDIWPHNYSMNSEVENYSGKELSMYYGLMKSLNTISARLVDALTPEAVYDFATNKMGLKLTELDSKGNTDKALSPLSVGALTYGVTVENMVNGYIPYGNGGWMYEGHIVSRLEQGNHELIYENKGNPYEAVDERTAYIMNRMMKNVVSANGTAGAAQLSNKEVVGKTGTTQNWDDLWFIGLTPDFVSGAWIGYIERQKLDTSISSARMWYNIIGEYADAIESDAEFPVPEEGIVEAPICTNTGLIAGKSCPKGEIGYWKDDNAPVCTGCRTYDPTGHTSESKPASGDDVITPVDPVTPVTPDPVEPLPIEPDPVTPDLPIPPAPIDDGGAAE
ncbi:MAG: transglycosylase domain-containing protein [Oscillospiraceae bacterium]|nr:transglycosylase domain-containing protein [Oscillospiraceae bacterium]